LTIHSIANRLPRAAPFLLRFTAADTAAIESLPQRSSFNRLKDRHKLKKLAAGCKQIDRLIGYRVTRLFSYLVVKCEGESDEKHGRGRPRQRSYG